MEPGCYLGRPMNPKPLKDALKRRPFRAFTVRLASGELIRIEKEHQALIHPATEKTLFIWVWLLFGNVKRPIKSGDFAQS